MWGAHACPASAHLIPVPAVVFRCHIFVRGYHVFPLCLACWIRIKHHHAQRAAIQMLNTCQSTMIQKSSDWTTKQYRPFLVWVKQRRHTGTRWEQLIPVKMEWFGTSIRDQLDLSLSTGGESPRTRVLLYLSHWILSHAQINALDELPAYVMKRANSCRYLVARVTTFTRV